MDATAPLRVFISYRREDTAGHAGRLHDSLRSRLAAAEIFMDVGGIEPGVDFTTAIADAVAGCDVMLALIGTRWATTTTSSGRRRLDEPDDYVVTEIATALERDTRVIPVLIEGAAMPEVGDLPERIRPLARCNALRLDTVSWPTDLEAVVAALRRLRPDAVPERPEPDPPSPDDRASAVGGAAQHRSGASPGPSWARRNVGGLAAAVGLAVAAVVAAVILAGGESGNEKASAVQAVVVTPESGPTGTTVELSGGPCPPAPDGRRPDGVYFGLHDPRAAPADENPATGGVPLIPGRPWKGELPIPDGVPAGQYFVYAGCFATDSAGAENLSFYQYVAAGFEVVDS